jgi:hypothetical protein
MEWVVSWVAVVVCALLASCSIPGHGVSRTDRFVDVNGVRWHYIDRGGNGNCLVFLTPLGGI